MIRALLESDSLDWEQFVERVQGHYGGLKFPLRAIARDVKDLWSVGAIKVSKEGISMDLEWPRRFSESDLLSRYENLPSDSPKTNPIPVDLTQLLGRSQ